MSRVNEYWLRLHHRGLRLVGAVTMLLALALLVTSPRDSLGSHVGEALMLVGVAGLTWLFWQKPS
jgi:hypothetical protein